MHRAGRARAARAALRPMRFLSYPRKRVSSGFGGLLRGGLRLAMTPRESAAVPFVIVQKVGPTSFTLSPSL